MDFLNRASSQVLDLFRSMTPAARITAALLLAVVVISLVYLVRFQTGGAGEYLLGGRAFSDREITNMEAAFAKAGLAHWETSENRIRVPRGQKPDFMAALVENDALPDSFGSYISKLNDNSGVLVNLTRPQRESQLKAATEQELALIFRSMKGIDEAAVRYDEIDRGGLRHQKEKTALVSARASNNRSLTADQVRAIRNAMVAFIAGLEPSHVTVLDLNSQLAHTETSLDDSASGGSAKYVEIQATYEQKYRDNIYDRLSMIPGVIVGVNVTLDPTMSQETTKLTFGPQTYALEASGLTKETSTTRPASGGRVGAVPNGVGNTPTSVSTASLSGSESTSTETTDQQRNILDQMTETSRLAGFIPQRVTASIDVPASYYEKIWREQHATAEGEPPAEPDPAELTAIESEASTNIEEAVIRLLPPPPAGDDASTLVKVTKYQDLTPPPLEQPGVAQTAFTWLGASWRTLGLILAGLASLMVLRGMIRSAQPSGPGAAPSAVFPIAAADSERDMEQEVDEESPAEGALKRRARSTGPTLREELAEMVHEDPDAAANVLRNWIGDAA